MKLDRIYTRGGDKGETSLGDGRRVPKSHIRIRVLGGLDEANAALGIALLHVDEEQVGALVCRIQNDLFDLGADLCRPETAGGKSALRVTAAQVTALESELDRFNAELEPLASFVLPGGTAAAVHLHLARAILRRAECDMVALAAGETVNAQALAYANRLSDLLFVLARYCNARGARDVLWAPGANQ
jgi:cob(I)alamin adenosyltransferase